MDATEWMDTRRICWTNLCSFASNITYLNPLFTVIPQREEYHECYMPCPGSNLSITVLPHSRKLSGSFPLNGKTVLYVVGFHDPFLFASRSPPIQRTLGRWLSSYTVLDGCLTPNPLTSNPLTSNLTVILFVRNDYVKTANRTTAGTGCNQPWRYSRHCP